MKTLIKILCLLYILICQISYSQDKGKTLPIELYTFKNQIINTDSIEQNCIFIFIRTYGCHKCIVDLDSALTLLSDELDCKIIYILDPQNSDAQSRKSDYYYLKKQFYPNREIYFSCRPQESDTLFGHFSIGNTPSILFRKENFDFIINYESIFSKDFNPEKIYEFIKKEYKTFYFE